MKIDLRSDTVTKPTPEMRRYMMKAEVGDDVFGEDPTVRRLEETVAQLLGKEAGLFVPTGVMGNQIALKVLTHPGDEVILDASSHIFNYESGAPGVLSGVQLHPVAGPRGIMSGDQVAAAIRPNNHWDPRTRLVCLENTVNKAGGVVYPIEKIREVEAIARRHGLALHLDGARLWHAAVATGISEAAYAQPFDTVSVCLSKGLGAPIGSVLVGSVPLIQAARRYRKMFGGGMRQVGFLAAAGLYAIEFHRPSLADDHRKAKLLAKGIAELPMFAIDPEAIETNIVIFDVRNGPAAPVIEALRERGVLVVPFGPSTIRAVTHRDVTEAEVTQAIEILHDLFGTDAASRAASASATN